MMFCINPIVAKHLEMFFWDVDYKFLNENQSRNRFSNGFMIFMSCVVKSYIFTVVIIDMRCGNNGSSEIATDVFDGDIGSAEIGFSTYVKTICMLSVDFIFYFKKSFTNARGKLLKKNLSEGITKKGVIKVFDGASRREVASTAFGDEDMDMRIPL